MKLDKIYNKQARSGWHLNFVKNRHSDSAKMVLSVQFCVGLLITKSHHGTHRWHYGYHIQYMSGVIWNSVLAIVFLLDKCFTSVINLRQLPKIWDENWLTIQSVPSQRHDTMVRRQIWFYIDVEEHNERLAALIVYNRVSPLNAHWVKSIFFSYNAVYVREKERDILYTIEPPLWWELLRKSSWLLLYRENCFSGETQT